MFWNHALQTWHPCYSPTDSRLAAIAIAVLTFALFASQVHAATEEKTSPQTPSQLEELTISPQEVMIPWKGDLDGMIQRGTIRVLTVYSKTFYFVDKGVQRGAAYEIFRLFEEDLNKKLAKDNKLKHKHLKVRMIFVPVARGDLLEALVAGKGDIAASNLTVTEERQKQVDFSVPTYRNASEVVVTGPASPPVSSVEELAGKVVFVRQSSSYYQSLTALNRRFATEKKPAVILKLAPENLEDEDLIEMLNAGLIPLIIVDKHKANFWKQIFTKITVHENVAVRTGGDIAWAIRKDSPQFLAAINNFVAGHNQGTTKGNIILARYLKNAKYVKDAASESERQKFLAMIQLFQKYGDQYDVDWLLMAAQGYQESQLNQAVKSKVGAIGVMQVMPATGKELAVGNISQVEPNIHAGIKYMRWMMDQYYGNEPMSKLDKALFAFASYNAGAGRISKLRKEAANRGLDPNVWFHNVEYVVAEKIGAETVTYVSNIYKYYIAYKLLIEARTAKEDAAKKLKGEIEEAR
ncbi:membrane-bound lytic murein transglycosylase MltF [Pseudomonas sp. Tn43]|uniref:transglycosylase SLT domain-containing protein n=1 Tax=Pseudomonas sp. Tn43 TaxID=701213 RepID=UPI001611082C|nr:lytic transglycosylase F [Pseudomonas sp. Tn43]MBB3239979.1 membrane-bound lytic murein transglycosylase MltF [Pseudomonas sp. Tn43]